MKYLVDTDIVIDFTREREPGFSIFKKICEKNYLSVSLITWIELAYGAKKSSRPNKEFIRLSNFIKDFDIGVINFEFPMAKKFVDLKIGLERKGVRLADFDLFIASTALSDNLTLVTRNSKHFKRIPKLKIYKK